MHIGFHGILILLYIHVCVCVCVCVCIHTYSQLLVWGGVTVFRVEIDADLNCGFRSPSDLALELEIGAEVESDWEVNVQTIQTGGY